MPHGRGTSGGRRRPRASEARTSRAAGAPAPVPCRSRVASARKGSPLSRRTIALCLGLAALAALVSAVLIGGGALSVSGVVRTTDSPAASPAEVAASVSALERRARVQARRLGLRAPAPRPLPDSEAGLARRAAQLAHVVAFLSDRRELAPALERSAVEASAGATPLERAVRRVRRASLRLGIAPPPAPRPAAHADGLAEQIATWRDVDAWLAHRSELRRPAERNAEAAAVAMEYRGTPYVYGGGSPSGFDCSGLVSFAYARVGTAMPHNTNAIWSAFRKVPRRDLRVGDMVFFSGLGHMGIYVGRGRYVHSPHSGDVVRVEALAARDDYVGAVRV